MLTARGYNNSLEEACKNLVTLRLSSISTCIHHDRIFPLMEKERDVQGLVVSNLRHFDQCVPSRVASNIRFNPIGAAANIVADRV
jgi:hypothetical protein